MQDKAATIFENRIKYLVRTGNPNDLIAISEIEGVPDHFKKQAADNIESARLAEIVCLREIGHFEALIKYSTDEALSPTLRGLAMESIEKAVHTHITRLIEDGHYESLQKTAEDTRLLTVNRDYARESIPLAMRNFISKVDPEEHGYRLDGSYIRLCTITASDVDEAIQKQARDAKLKIAQRAKGYVRPNYYNRMGTPANESHRIKERSLSSLIAEDTDIPKETRDQVAVNISNVIDLGSSDIRSILTSDTFPQVAKGLLEERLKKAALEFLHKPSKSRGLGRNISSALILVVLDPTTEASIRFQAEKKLFELTPSPGIFRDERLPSHLRQAAEPAYVQKLPITSATYSREILVLYLHTDFYDVKEKCKEALRTHVLKVDKTVNPLARDGVTLEDVGFFRRAGRQIKNWCSTKRSRTG